MTTKCECGFKFSGPGEFRNCDSYITSQGQHVLICPDCLKHWVME